MPLAHDVADNARPQTDKFIEDVMRPAVEDLISILEKQADEMSKKVSVLRTSQRVIWHFRGPQQPCRAHPSHPC